MLAIIVQSTVLGLGDSFRTYSRLTLRVRLSIPAVRQNVLLIKSNGRFVSSGTGFLVTLFRVTKVTSKMWTRMARHLILLWSPSGSEISQWTLGLEETRCHGG